MEVYLLWHVHEMPDGEDDVKLIGVYATAEDVEAARLRVLPLPGFRDLPGGVRSVAILLAKTIGPRCMSTCRTRM